MIVYLFYRLPPKEYPNDIPTLYAFTDDKKLQEEFQNQRNIKIFSLIKKKNITKQEFAYFCSAHNKLRLVRTTLSTSGNEYGEINSVDVVCTLREEESIVKNTESLYKEYQKYLFDASIFKDKYLKSLDKLLFIKFYVFYMKNKEYEDYYYTPYYSAYGPPEGYMDDLDEYHSHFAYDELKLFLRYYQDTFKKE